jgi:hypothetical protein
MTNPAKTPIKKPHKATSQKASKPTAKKAIKKPLKKSANDAFAVADATLSREYIELVVEAMGRK